jgi:hypothetical protein
MQGMRYLIVLFVGLFSIGTIACEIYKGDLSLDFQCLRQEVRVLSVLGNQPEEVKKRSLVIAEQGLDGNKEEIKVIQ